MKSEGIIRGGLKLAASGSVQMMLGGIVAAVIPHQVSIAYKAAAYIGGLVVSAFVGDRLDKFVDEKVDEAKECVNEVVDLVNIVNIIKEESNNTEPESGG